MPEDKLFRIAPDRNAPPRLLLEGELESTPRCSPDGTMLAYQDGAHIYLMNLDDKSVTQLTTAGGVQSWPVWSLDGSSLTYCQASDCFGPWDIYRVDLRNPQIARFTRRDVHVAHDWSGIGKMNGDDRVVMGAQVSVWAGEALGDLDEPDRLYGDRAGWQRVPAVNQPEPLEGPVLIENDWFFVGFNPRTDAISLWPKSKPQTYEKLFIVSLDENGRRIRAGETPLQMSIIKGGNEEIIVRISSSTPQAKVFSSIWKIHRSKPYIKIIPLDGSNSFLIQRDMRFVVSPDRFANDLLLVADHYEAPEVSLPLSPFVFGFPQGEGNILMLITPSTEQSSTLTVERRGFSGIKTFTKGEPIFVCLLPGADHWSEAEVKADPQGSDVEVEWSYPFSGRWRISLFGAATKHSVMVDAKNPSKIKAIKEFSDPVQIALVYLYGRNANTPLNILTPEDILRDALGLQLSERLLDIEGITNYRTTEEPIPLHELLMPASSRYRSMRVAADPDWPWRIAWRESLRLRLGFSPILELLGGGDYGAINMANTEGITSTVGHFSSDILNLLSGLDERIREYERFLSDFKKGCKTGWEENAQAADCLNKITAEIKEAKGKCANIPVTEIAQIQAHIEKMQALFGSQGRLGKKKIFERFCEASISALAERQAVLKEYRELAKRTRDKASLIITEKPETKDIAEQIRRLTQRILRNRYYLEDDWRGEIPQYGGAR